jgi:hypothetical protein
MFDAEGVYKISVVYVITPTCFLMFVNDDKAEGEAFMKWHPGIRIDKIPVTATVAGLIFAAGIVVLAIVGVPEIRGLVLNGLPGGILFAAILSWWRSRT